MSSDTAPDTANSPRVTDHKYSSTKKDLTCDHCGLGQAGHAESEESLKFIATEYRCPDCVSKGVNPCPHQ